MSEKIRKVYDKLSSEQKDEICVLYLEGITCKKISEQFNCSKTQISHVVKGRGIVKSRKERLGEITVEIISELKYLNSLNINFTKISERINLSLYKTLKLAKELGLNGPPTSISQRKYYLNENWLNEIDCPEKAIYLGLFFADGCNHSSCNECTIELCKIDKSYLQRLNDLFSGKPLTKTTDRAFRSSVVSSVWTNKLIEYGAVPVKSLILEWPKNIPDEFIKYFIRGFFEGDGGFATVKNKIAPTSYYMNFTSTKEFLESLKEILFKFLPLKGKLSIYKNKILHDRNTFCLKIDKQFDVKLICDWIYSDKIEYAMERKYEKYQQFLKDRVRDGEVILYNQK